MLEPSPSMCFIIQDTKEKESSSGFILSVDDKRKHGQGTIYSLNSEVVCPHCVEKFNRKDLAVGDKVMFSKYVAEQIEYDGDGLKGKVVFAVPIDSILAKIV